MTNKKTSERHNTTANDKPIWSLPREEAIARLMQKYDMSRERAEAIWHRDRTHIRRDAVERLSEEEFNGLEAELANSPSVLTLSRKDLKKQQTDDADNGSLSVEDEITRLMQTYHLSRQRAEAVLKEKEAPHIRRHPMIPVTREEFDELMEEIACSGEKMSIFGKMKAADQEQQDE